ncbi:helix-turn-helix domain-containing protein [Enemella dayhoffiae]|uniref:helix-turn-helix domain-containing protein n=1 Tax=Enemella dayhoffiae TaxID=2016507 RepID=UPI001E2A265E|nr:helix-turn-helix transcriptional regulator [Enemella dayhoffiae]
MSETEPPKSLLGTFIRQQRELAELSMRQMSTMVGISNPYLSQIERGLRAPSAGVAAGIATALGISVDELYQRAGYVSAKAEAGEKTDLQRAIDSASELTAAQRRSLSEVYRSFVDANRVRHPD